VIVTKIGFNVAVNMSCALSWHCQNVGSCTCCIPRNSKRNWIFVQPQKKTSRQMKLRTKTVWNSWEKP